MVEGLVWLWKRPLLRTTALLVAGSNLLFRALFLVMIVLLAEEGAGPAAIGLLIGVAGACGMLGSLVAGWCGRRLRMNALVISANWVWALLMCVLAFGGGLWPAMIAYTAMWFVGPIWNVAVGSYQLAVTPDELRGRVLSASSLLANGALPLGALAGGLLLGRTSGDCGAGRVDGADGAGSHPRRAGTPGHHARGRRPARVLHGPLASPDPARPRPGRPPARAVRARSGGGLALSGRAPARPRCRGRTRP